MDIFAIAPDSFKGAISAEGAARAIAEGLSASFPKAEFRLIPMADGGEGTVDAWAASTAATRIRATVQDPLGRPVKAEYAYDPSSGTAVIEMAAASGLPLLVPGERNPLTTSTYGTGELVRDALDHGARHIILGIGKLFVVLYRGCRYIYIDTSYISVFMMYAVNGFYTV